MAFLRPSLGIVALISAWVFELFDCSLTYYFLHRGFSEVNIYVAFLVRNAGPLQGLFLGKIFPLMVLTFLREFVPPFLWCVLLGGVVVSFIVLSSSMLFS